MRQKKVQPEPNNKLPYRTAMYNRTQNPASHAGLSLLLSKRTLNVFLIMKSKCTWFIDILLLAIMFNDKIWQADNLINSFTFWECVQ